MGDPSSRSPLIGREASASGRLALDGTGIPISLLQAARADWLDALLLARGYIAADSCGMFWRFLGCGPALARRGLPRTKSAMSAATTTKQRSTTPATGSVLLPAVGALDAVEHISQHAQVSSTARRKSAPSVVG